MRFVSFSRSLRLCSLCPYGFASLLLVMRLEGALEDSGGLSRVLGGSDGVGGGCGDVVLRWSSREIDGAVGWGRRRIGN